jgi:predicted Ser/Thr protein kinase
MIEKGDAKDRVDGFLARLHQGGDDAEHLLDQARDRLKAITWEVEEFAAKERVGAGGRGEVVLAESRPGAPVHEKVALKVAQDGADSESFLWEAQLLARLRHPGLPRFRRFGQEKAGRPFYAMDYIAGQSLAQRQASGAALLAEHAVDVLTQLFDTVGYLHDQGVAHLDLKPDNVMIDPERHVYVVDLGSALPYKEALAPEMAARLKSQQYGPGREYTAPELNPAHSDVTVNPRPTMDVYSLGRLALDCAAQLPRCGLRRELEAIGKKATKEEPSQRYASGWAMRDEMNRIARSEPVEAMGQAPLYRLGKWIRRHYTWALYAAAIAIVATSSVAWLERTWRGEAEMARKEVDAKMLKGYVITKGNQDAEAKRLADYRKNCQALAQKWSQEIAKASAEDEPDQVRLWYLAAAALDKANEARDFKLRDQIRQQMGKLSDSRGGGVVNRDLPAVNESVALSVLDKVEYWRSMGECETARQWMEMARAEVRSLIRMDAGLAQGAAAQRLKAAEAAACATPGGK